MNCTIRHTLALLCLVVPGLVSASAAEWTTPTAEELSMSSQPEVPGAPAVYLFREEITDDQMHSWSKYVRLKVLTERGKDYANVELRQYQGEDGAGYTVGEIQGRTIHADGTVIPFTGKPYQKVIEKARGYKEMAKVFTLPDVQVGSIIEYRYVLRYDDNRFIAPSWFIQSDLFTRKAHYLWKPTGEQLVTKSEHGEQLTSAIAWAQILPPGAQLKQITQPGASYSKQAQNSLDLNVQNVPPAPDEDYMPPIQSFTYRVLFYYTPYRGPEDFWKNEGKGWSKTTDKFIGPGPKVGAAVQALTAGATSQDDKLKKLYAAVMQLDNTAFSRGRSRTEDKAQGLGPAKNTDDIWERKRGSDDQLAELFVAMARAAGMKAYVMYVVNRERNLFNPNFQSFGQFDDEIAIVNVDGKERYFDPGQRYCPYGHLAWKHSLVQGIRQTDAGTAIGGTPAESYKEGRTQRIADLKVDEHGEATGTVKITFTGAPALRWRQMSLTGDTTSLEQELRTTVEHMLPGGMEVKLSSTNKLEDYEQPLTVSFNVKGQVGSSTGKRLILPADIFEVNEKPAFPHEKREVAVYFQYPSLVQDAVRFTYPATLGLESEPTSANVPYKQTAVYELHSVSAANSVTTYRNLIRGDIVFPVPEYPDLRAFFGKLESKDQEPIILKVQQQAASK